MDKSSSLDLIDWEKMKGIVPVVVVNYMTGEVLMQAYADSNALSMSINTGYAHYFSRSRGRLWKKGETSGNTQVITSIAVDCDGDCLLYEVIQNGPACHTGEQSCFFRKIYEVE